MARPLAAVGLVLGVLAGHWLLLESVAGLLPTRQRLQVMATPLFTRELVRSTPVTVPAADLASKQAVAQVGRTKFATTKIAEETLEPSAAPQAGDRAGDTLDPGSTGTTAPGTTETPETSASPTMAAGTATASVAPGALADTPQGTPPEPVTPAGGAAVEAAAVEAAAGAGLDSWPADTRLSYALSGFYRGPISGDARVQWQRDGAKYQVRVDLGLSGLTIFSMTSQGVVTPKGLQPTVYEERRLGGKAVQVMLEPQQVRLNDGTRVERPADTQDTASQFVELSHRFATGRTALDLGRNVPLWLARPNAVAEWTYDIVALDTLESARLGTISAYHLKPRPLAKPSGPITAEMWFAPSFQYLPVRIKITLNAETWVDMMIEKIEQGRAPATATTATTPVTPATPASPTAPPPDRAKPISP
jgi:hypothetical protein